MNHESCEVKAVECQQVENEATKDMERDGIFPATGDADQTEEDEEEETELPEGAQESPRVRIGPTPARPSEAEVEDHRLTHWPYRSWCDECALGRGLGEQRAGSSGSSDIPVVGIDFWYVTAGSIQSREELEYELTETGEARLAEGRRVGSIVKCLMVRCFKTKCVFGHVIPMRGGHENA